ncbi:ankyrin repeat domain-containing protein [Oceanispirochaeta crateris]|uniref:Ankyrin repeat domain-containing protein n=1 Tax=Oceanispirochaeta crateris TaxID=2518645 RepID=A0A5C1QID4_9SPIO|nr:ankyrin repeat domain-containing protein [Oceanispirochaeta crateris]QEN07925.1 ankyrin repeat domain-containing protein [Oceanispirochaeta crateris]
MEQLSKANEEFLARLDFRKELFRFIIIFGPLNICMLMADSVGPAQPILALLMSLVSFIIIFWKRKNHASIQSAEGILLETTLLGNALKKDEFVPSRGVYKIFLGESHHDRGHKIKTSYALNILLYPYRQMKVSLDYFKDNGNLIPVRFQINTGVAGRIKIRALQFQQQNLWFSMILMATAFLIPLSIIPNKGLLNEWQNREELYQEMIVLNEEDSAKLFELSEASAIYLKSSRLDCFVFPDEDQSVYYIDPNYEIPQEEWEAVVRDASLLSDFVDFIHMEDCLIEANWAPYDHIFSDSVVYELGKRSFPNPEFWEDKPFQRGSNYLIYDLIMDDLENSNYFSSLNRSLYLLIKELKANSILLPVELVGDKSRLADDSLLFPDFGSSETFKIGDFSWSWYGKMADSKLEWLSTFLIEPRSPKVYSFLGRINIERNGYKKLEGYREPYDSLRFYGILGTIALNYIFLFLLLYQFMPILMALLSNKENAFNFYSDEKTEMDKAKKKRQRLIALGVEMVQFSKQENSQFVDSGHSNESISSLESVEMIPPAFKAIAEANLPALKSIIDLNPEIARSIYRGNSLLNISAEMFLEPDVLEYLIEKGADVNFRDSFQMTPIMMHAYWGNPESVKLLLSHGAEVNAVDLDGKTPLMHAIESDFDEQSAEIVSLLLAGGADKNVRDKEGKSVLDYTVKMKRKYKNLNS